jgi:ABC-type transport system substrate-binding protein
MNLRRVLVVVPMAIGAILLQSAFWVPTYGSQAKGNAGRLTTYIEASIGDAKRLNPILASDQGSSDIYGRRIMEALIDSDENLNLKGRLAESWVTTEEAYLAPIPERRLPDGASATAATLMERLKTALTDGKLGALTSVVDSVEVVPPLERTFNESIIRPGKDGKPEPYEIKGKVSIPERVKLRLKSVTPDLFERLKPVLGADYFDVYPFERAFRLAKPGDLALLRPKLKDLFPVGEHNPVITFRLRKGVRFHDGAPFTSRDVRFTYLAANDPRNASPRSSSFEPIRDVEILDDYAVRVIYKRLYAPAIIDWALEIIPEHRLGEVGLKAEMDRRKISPEARKQFTLRESDFNQNPIGTGPFRFVEWKPEEFIHLTRNEDYWGPRPEYRDIYARVIPDYVAQELELRAGAVDYYQPLPHQANRYRKDEDYHFLQRSEGYYSYIGYNLRRPLFQDVRVRRALGMAIDVDAIIKYVLYGQGKRATGPFYSNTPYYDPDTPLLPYDPKAALDLLESAGWKRNAEGWLEKDGKVFEFTLITNNANPQRKAIMTLAQAAWRKIGVRCSIQDFEWTVFLEDFVDVNQFDAFVLAWGGGDINPDKYEVWHSTQTDSYELNHVGYKSAEADALIERIREEYDHDKQIELTKQLHRMIANDAPYTFLIEPRQAAVLDKKIMLVDRAPDGTERYSQIERVPSGEIAYFFNKWRKLPHAVAVPEN